MEYRERPSRCKDCMYREQGNSKPCQESRQLLCDEGEREKAEQPQPDEHDNYCDFKDEHYARQGDLRFIC